MISHPTRTAWTLYLAGMAVYSDMYITQPILPLLSKEYGIAPAVAALSVSLMVLAVTLASSFYGPLSDRLGRKPVMVWSCALLALPTLLCAVAPSFPLLLLCRALQGALLPGVAGVAVTYIGEHFEPGHVGEIVGNYIAATVVGGMSGRLISGVIAEWLNWRAGFLFFALTTLATAFFLARVLPAQTSGHTIALNGTQTGMIEHLRNRRLVGGFLAGLSIFFAFISIFTYLPYLLTGPPFHLSQAIVSMTYVVYIAGVFVSPVAGRLSRRYARRWIMVVGMGVQALGILLTLSHSLLLIGIGLIVICLGMFTVQSTAPAYINATAQRAKGSAGTLYLTFYYLGAVLGSFLPGLAWQSFGWIGVVASSLLVLVVGIGAVVGLCGEKEG